MLRRKHPKDKEGTGVDLKPDVESSIGYDYAFEKLLAHTKFDCLGLFCTSDINDMLRQRIGSSGRALMDNLDPCCIYASNHRIKAEVSKMVDNFRAQGYIVNLGHGRLPDMEPEHVNKFVKRVQAK